MIDPPTQPFLVLTLWSFFIQRKLRKLRNPGDGSSVLDTFLKLVVCFLFCILWTSILKIIPNGFPFNTHLPPCLHVWTSIEISWNCFSLKLDIEFKKFQVNKLESEITWNCWCSAADRFPRETDLRQCWLRLWSPGSWSSPRRARTSSTRSCSASRSSTCTTLRQTFRPTVRNIKSSVVFAFY